MISELRNEAESAKHELWEEKRFNKTTLGILEEEKGETEHQLLVEVKNKKRELENNTREIQGLREKLVDRDLTIVRLEQRLAQASNDMATKERTHMKKNSGSQLS